MSSRHFKKFMRAATCHLTGHCKRYMKHSQASRGWSVVYCRKFDGSFHGERSRMTLGLIGPAENTQMRWKLLSVFVHMQAQVQGRASRTQSMGAGISYIDGWSGDTVCRWRRCSHKFGWHMINWLGVTSRAEPSVPWCGRSCPPPQALANISGEPTFRL